jgi:hypothetical protein
MAGLFVVSLGCSTEPYSGSGLQDSRQLGATERLPSRRPSRVSVPGAQLGSDETCDGVPDCQAQPQPSFWLSEWETTRKHYQCKTPYPFGWNASLSQQGSSVTHIPSVWASDPGTVNVLLTNWNPIYHELVSLTLACSKRNSFGGTCGAVTSDPGCPVIGGSEHNYCSGGPVPVCFQTYQERCSAGNQLFQCTIDLGIAWCQPCPG